MSICNSLLVWYPLIPAQHRTDNPRQLPYSLQKSLHQLNTRQQPVALSRTKSSNQTKICTEYWCWSKNKVPTISWVLLLNPRTFARAKHWILIHCANVSYCHANGAWILAVGRWVFGKVGLRCSLLPLWPRWCSNFRWLRFKVCLHENGTTKIELRAV